MVNWRIMQRKSKNYIDESQLSSDNIYSSINQNNALVYSHLNYNYCFISCSKCEKNCAFRLSEINPNNSSLSQKQINEELKIHGHPKSRINKKTRRNRSLLEAKKELENHYKNYHLNK